MIRVLITGNQGYIGQVLTVELKNRGYEVYGYDSGYYKGLELAEPVQPDVQIEKDIRDALPEDFDGVDAVIHLAALSNDPLGELNSELTRDINLGGTLRVAKAAKEAGVKRFIYASSQSMYGISQSDEELDEDESEKNPITMYARTKWEAEEELKKMCDDNFLVVCFRPSTVFGPSPSFRADIVFNNLVASAYTAGKIEVKSDGTPWRPVVHIRDVCQAFIAGLEAPANLVACRSFNVGIENGNYTVRELAEAAQKAVPGSQIVFTGEHGADARTYRVSFKRILEELKDYYKPQWSLENGGRELVEFFKRVNFTEEKFRGRNCNRVQQIKYLLNKNLLDENLRWQKND